MLYNLYKYLLSKNLIKEAAEVKELEEYEEPWHEEAIKEFGEEPPDEKAALKELEELYEEEYSEYYVGTNNIYNKILKDNNFKTLYSSNSKLIGRGAYGKVFQGIFRGKPAVAKIIVDEQDSHEFDNWLEILSLKKIIPENLHKHIPIIYDLNKSTIEHRGHKTPYEIIIMEKLYPLSNDIETIIRDAIHNIKNVSENLWKDEEFLYELSQKIEELIEIEYEYIFTISSLEIFKVILNSKFNFLSPNSTLINSTLISKKIIEFIIDKNIPDDLKNDPKIKKDLKYLEISISSLISRLYTSSLWPRDYNESLPISYKYLNETRSILEFLLVLSQYGIKWADLHDKNLMQDSQGNLKIIDVGLYSV